MRVYPKGRPGEPAEAAIYDGTAASAAAVVQFCGHNHSNDDRVIRDPASGKIAVADDRADGVLTLRMHELDKDSHDQKSDGGMWDGPIPVGSCVINPHRGGFLVLSAEEFSADWERSDG